MKHYVYILTCADDTLYSGYTTDLKRRLHEHNHSSKGARYTRARRPVCLAHAEAFDTLSQALKREHAIKSMDRRSKIAMIESQKLCSC